MDDITQIHIRLSVLEAAINRALGRGEAVPYEVLEDWLSTVQGVKEKLTQMN